MGFADIVRSGINTANTLTGDLQQTVCHFRWKCADAYGKPEYDDVIERQALVEFKARLVRRANGEETNQRAMVTFIGPIDPMESWKNVTERDDPFDPRDKLVLADGTTGPILGINGLGDPATDAPFMYEVSLGSER